MLVVVHKALVGESGEAWEEGRRDWLYLDASGCLHEGRPDVSGRAPEAILAERLQKSTQTAASVNRIVLVAPAVRHDEVQRLVRHVLGLPKDDFWVDVAVVTACDAETDLHVAGEITSAQELQAADRHGRLRSIWMMGRITSKKDEIGPQVRADAMDYLLHMLSQGGEECAARLGLAHEGDAQRSPCRVCAWGFRSFMPGATEIDTLMGQEFRKSIAGNGRHQALAGAPLPELMKRKAEGFLGAGLQLDLAFDGQEGQDAKAWRDTLPNPPETPLRSWRCRVLGTGEEMAWLGRGLLRRHEPKILTYYHQLISFLGQQAKTIRLKGQDRLAHISQDARLFILEEKRLDRLSAALRHFFPAFYISSTPAAPNAACPREHDPSSSDVVRKIVHEMIDKSAARCRSELLTAKQRAWLLGGLAVAVLISALILWLTHWDLRGTTPVVLAVFVLVIVDAVNRRRFNRVKAAMNAEIEKEQANLRGEFARKVEWVLDKTGLTVQKQVVADMTALESLLRRKVDFLAGIGCDVAPDEGQPHDGLHLPSEIAEQIRDRVADAASHVLSLDEDAAEVEWERVLDRSKRQIVSLVEPPAPSESTPLDERLAQCCAADFPPFLAQYDGVFNQKLYSKLFFLPRNTPRSWIDTIQRKASNCGDQQVSIHKGDFKGASVVVRYDGLKPDQLAACFAVPQGQTTQG